MANSWKHAGTFEARVPAPLGTVAQSIGNRYILPTDRAKGISVQCTEDIHAGAARYIDVRVDIPHATPRPILRLGIDITVDRRAVRIFDGFVPASEQFADAKLERILREMGIRRTTP